MLGHRLRGGLLQRIVGEQPIPRVGELGRRSAAQKRCLDQDRCTVTELPSYRGDVGDARRVCQFMARDLAERLGSGLATQIGDRVEIELYDGFTPVSITL